MTRNEPSALYDADFFVWTQRQAAALRAMPRNAIGAEIDIDHLAEEIEDLGKRDLREVGSFLARLIEHLLKLDACPRSRERGHWLSEAGHFHASAVAAFTPGMRRLLILDKIWSRGRKNALLSLDAMGVASSPPTRCPFDLDQLLSEEFDILAALSELEAHRPSRDTPRP